MGTHAGLVLAECSTEVARSARLWVGCIIYRRALEMVLGLCGRGVVAAIVIGVGVGIAIVGVSVVLWSGGNGTDKVLVKGRAK